MVIPVIHNAVPATASRRPSSARATSSNFPYVLRPCHSLLQGPHTPEQKTYNSAVVPQAGAAVPSVGTRGTPGCEFALPVTATHQGLPQSLTRQFQQRLEADLAVRDPPAATSPMSWVPATAALIEDWVDVIPADTELGPQPALYCCSLRPEAPAPDWAWAGLA